MSRSCSSTGEIRKHRRAASAGVLMASVAATAIAWGSATPAGAADYVWTMVTDQAGLGDQGFNDLAKLGLDMSAKDAGGKVQVIQSSDQSQFVPNLQQAVNTGSTVTVGVGFLIKDAVTEVAMANPKAHFTLIDAVSTDKGGKPLDNVASVTFRENEGAFLAGIAAAMTTKTNKLGFIGGMETPPVVRFLAGYQAGIRTVNPEIKVSVAYVGSFKDPAKAKELALGMFDISDDVIMDVAGGGGRGIYDAAKGLGADHWVIGVDTCKTHLAPDNVLTSAVKDVAGAVYRENKSAADGSFQGGAVVLGLKQGAVGLCKDNLDKMAPAILEKIKASTAAIDDGSLVVPANLDELASFKPAMK